MQRIPLTQGKYALVDNEDFEYLNQWKWSYGCGGYAIRVQYLGGGQANKKQQMIYMHKLLLSELGKKTDHKDTNKLNNSRSNLRVCTQADNTANQSLKSSNTSGFKGVVRVARNQRKPWAAQIAPRGKGKFLGYFMTKEEAALAYNRAARLAFGEFAKLNEVKI